MVHNGIIENYIDLKRQLQAKGYHFYSDTDTEVVAKLLEDLYETDLMTTVMRVTQAIVGAYALVIIDTESPDTMIATKLGSPMILGISDEAFFLSSDINAVSREAGEFITLEDHEIVRIEHGSYSVFSAGTEVSREKEKMTAEFQSSEKGAFETFTEKEISEIPEAFRNALKGRVNFETRTITSETLDRL